VHGKENALSFYACEAVSAKIGLAFCFSRNIERGTGVTHCGLNKLYIQIRYFWIEILAAHERPVFAINYSPSKESHVEKSDRQNRLYGVLRE
jgi:hypothetical protein